MLDARVDTSTVSAGDLENIIETETPPQSPAMMSPEVQPLMSSSRRRCSIIVGVDMDDDHHQGDADMSDKHHQAVDDDDVPLPKAVEPVHSPVSSLPSSPQPSSPLAFSVCPLRLGKTFAFTSTDAESRPVSSAAEAFIQRQQEQVGRIAEYDKRTSLISEAQLAVSVVLAALVTFSTACEREDSASRICCANSLSSHCFYVKYTLCSSGMHKPHLSCTSRVTVVDLLEYCNRSG